MERIGRLVGQLLDLSRADALHVETIDSKEFFEELALFARMAVKKKNCALEGAHGHADRRAGAESMIPPLFSVRQHP